MRASNFESDGPQHMEAVYHQGKSSNASTSESHWGDLIMQRYDRNNWRVGLLQSHIRLREPDKPKDKVE